MSYCRLYRNRTIHWKTRRLDKSEKRRRWRQKLLIHHHQKLSRIAKLEPQYCKACPRNTAAEFKNKVFRKRLHFQSKTNLYTSMDSFGDRPREWYTWAKNRCKPLKLKSMNNLTLAKQCENMRTKTYENWLSKIALLRSSLRLVFLRSQKIFYGLEVGRQKHNAWSALLQKVRSILA